MVDIIKKLYVMANGFLNSGNVLDGHNVEVKKAAVGMGAGATFYGASMITMNNIVGFLTSVYFIMQIWILLPKFWTAIRNIKQNFSKKE